MVAAVVADVAAPKTKQSTGGWWDCAHVPARPTYISDGTESWWQMCAQTAFAGIAAVGSDLANSGGWLRFAVGMMVLAVVLMLLLVVLVVVDVVVHAVYT